MLGPCQLFAVPFIPIILRNFNHFLQLTKFPLLEDASVLTPQVSQQGRSSSKLEIR